MISTTEYNYMIDLRNGVVDVDTDSEIEDFGSSESDDSDSSSSDEPVTRENVIDKVEEYEGEPLDTETYTYKVLYQHQLHRFSNPSYNCIQ